MPPGLVRNRSRDETPAPKRAPVDADESRPKERTYDFVLSELGTVRDQLDRCLIEGKLGLAGECSAELEQLTIELARIRALRQPGHPIGG